MDPSIITMMILIFSFDLSIVQHEVITIEICQLLWSYLCLVAQKHCRDEHNNGETTWYHRLWPWETLTFPNLEIGPRKQLYVYTLKKNFMFLFILQDWCFFLLLRRL